MNSIEISQLNESNTIQIKVHRTDLIPLRKHLGKMISDEIIQEARRMDASGYGIQVNKIAEKYHCSVQYVYYVLKQKKISLAKTTRIIDGKEN